MNLDAPWQPQGAVYGTLLNFRREHALWAPRMDEAPYKAAPRAPVLYVKTANTFACAGAAVPVPSAVELGATLGLVMGAGGAPVGAVLVNDLSLPHASYYRPAIRFRNRDGFLVCAPAVTPLSALALNTLVIEARVNGTPVQTVDLSTLVRDAATLLADVAEFMTLQAGDVLLLGTDCLEGGTRPRVKAGDRVEIRADGLAPLNHTLAPEAA